MGSVQSLPLCKRGISGEREKVAATGKIEHHLERIGEAQSQKFHTVPIQIVSYKKWRRGGESGGEARRTATISPVRIKFESGARRGEEKRIEEGEERPSTDQKRDERHKAPIRQTESEGDMDTRRQSDFSLGVHKDAWYQIELRRRVCWDS